MSRDTNQNLYAEQIITESPFYYDEYGRLRVRVLNEQGINTNVKPVRPGGPVKPPVDDEEDNKPVARADAPAPAPAPAPEAPIKGGPAKPNPGIKPVTGGDIPRDDVEPITGGGSAKPAPVKGGPVSPILKPPSIGIGKPKPKPIGIGKPKPVPVVQVRPGIYTTRPGMQYAKKGGPVRPYMPDPDMPPKKGGPVRPYIPTDPPKIGRPKPKPIGGRTDNRDERNRELYLRNVPKDPVVRERVREAMKRDKERRAAGWVPKYTVDV